MWRSILAGVLTPFAVLLLNSSMGGSQGIAGPPRLRAIYVVTAFLMALAHGVDTRCGRAPNAISLAVRIL